MPNEDKQLTSCPDDRQLLTTGWPWEGRIEFRDGVTMRYRPDTELVLKGVSLAIRCAKCEMFSCVFEWWLVGWLVGWVRLVVLLVVCRPAVLAGNGGEGQGGRSLVSIGLALCHDMGRG